MASSISDQSNGNSSINQLLRQLLGQKRPGIQMIGAFLGGCIGLLMLLGATQLYFDVNDLLNGPDGEGQQFVQINKQVNILNTLAGAARFTPEEIEAISKQPFVKAIGPFTSNDFKVGASSQTLGFYTELFFEAVPDEFLDFPTGGFQWEEGDEVLPIVMARDYLALYNFGFAPSQGLPQFNQNTIKRASFTIIIRGPSGRKQIRGKIVGFSDRVNSILVPQTFMDWANKNYGQGEKTGASRLMLQIENPLAEDFRSFVKDEGYELSTGRLIGGQFTFMLNLLTGIIFVIGFLIVLLAALVFALNFNLLLARGKQEVQLLLQLGFKQHQIFKVFDRTVKQLYLAILITALLLLQLGHLYLADWFGEQGYDIAGVLHWSVFVLAILLMAAVYLLTIRSLKKNITASV